VAKNRIEVKITGDTKGLSKALGVAETKMERFGRGVKTGMKRASIALSGLGAAAVIAAPKVLEMSAELEAMSAKSQTVFEGSLGDVQKWADGSASAMGLTSEQLVGLAAGTAGFGFGFDSSFLTSLVSIPASINRTSLQD